MAAVSLAAQRRTRSRFAVLVSSASGGASGSPSAAMPAAILALSPIGYWKLNETSGTSITDHSGNGHTGTVVGTVTLAATAGPDPSGDSYASFGGGSITVPDAAAFSANTASGLTVFAIAKPTSLPAARRFIVSKGAAAAYEWELTHGNVASGRIYGSFYEPSGGALMSRYITGMSTGWNVLAYRGPSPVKDADTDHYRNSPTEVTSTAGTTFAGTYTDNAAKVRIGFRDDTPSGQAFEGTLCHVAIFAGEVDLTTVFDAATADGWY